MTALTEANIRPFGVNPASVASHQKYVAKFQFPFALLADIDREAAGAFHALKGDGRKIQRTVYLIGRDGTVRYAVRGAPPPREIIEAMNGSILGGDL
jgi:peroxiredoxin Q/BCP